MAFAASCRLLRGRATVLAWAASSLLACGGGGHGGGGPADAAEDPTGDGSVNGFSRRLLLEHLATRFLIPTYEQLATTAGGLVTAVDAYCAAPAPATRTAAQDAWRAAIDVWQRASAVLVGPAAMDNGAVSNRIYSWPLLSTCSLDTDTAARATSPASYDVETRFDNARSLTSVEYLLFVEPSTNHTCADAPPGWNQIVFTPGLEKARCDLAAAIARDVAGQAQKLLAAWKPDGGNYVAQLVEAGTPRSSIASAQEAVNLVSDSLFYVDRLVKDMKMAEAAGIAVNSCNRVGEPCLDEVEHRLSDHGKQAIVLNLHALRVAFTGRIDGTDGPAFDDFLREVGAADLAATMTANLDAAIAAAEAIPDSFVGALASDRPRIVAAHAALKLFTDDQKSRFLAVLALDIPDDIAADND